MEQDEINKIETDINNKNAVEERVRKAISDKKESEARADAAIKAKAESDEKLAQMEKETKFLNSFSEALGKNPEAAEYRDKIKEKFNSGYSLNDALITTLVGEGKYTPPPVQRENVAGGSASNQIVNNNASKSVGQMSKDEKLQGLLDAEKRGDLGLQ